MFKLIPLAIVGLTLAIVGLAQPNNIQASGSAQTCTNPAKGVLRDQFDGTDQFLTTWNMNKITIKNTSTNCAYKVGIASYSAYEHYTQSVYSQTYYSSRTVILQPGSTWTYTIRIPSCTYQVDAYWGDTISQFTKPNGTYSGQGRLLDAWYFPGTPDQQGKLPTCAHATNPPQPQPEQPTQLPATGPGAMALIGLGGPMLGLMARKYFMG